MSACVEGGASRPTGRLPKHSTALRLVALLSATFAGAYYSNMALVPLDAMLEHFGTSVALGSLVLGGFAVPLAAATPLASHVGEGIGLTRALYLAVGILALGSVVAALSPDLAALVAVRFLQGIAAAVIVPSVMILLSTSFSESERPVTLGLWSAVNSLGRVVSVPVAGLLTTAAGWSAVFWSAVPICGIAAVAVAAIVPRRAARRASLDGWTAAALTGGSTLLLGGLTAIATDHLGELLGFPAGVLGAGLLVVAWRRARRRPGGILPVDALASTTLLRSSIGGFVQMAIILIDITGVSLYLVRTAGESAGTAGLVALAFPGVMVVVSTAAGPAMRHLGGRRVFWGGMALLGASQVGIALALGAGQGVSAAIIGSLGIAGAGAALVQTATAGGATRPEHRDATAAVGVFNLVRFSGSAVGAAWLAIAFSLGAGYRALFLSAAAVCGGALLMSAMVGKGRRPAAGTGPATADGGPGVA